MIFKFFNKPKVERVSIDESKFPKSVKSEKIIHPSKEEVDKMWNDESTVSKINLDESITKAAERKMQEDKKN